MKTNYTIKNFRVFDKNGVTIPISPLTFLVGCNSSGKSSIVKSLFLLKGFLTQKRTSSYQVIDSVIDFSVNPAKTLGSFSNVVSSSGKQQLITLAYDVHSDYINNDVKVSLIIGPGELGNAEVDGLEITRTDGSLIVRAVGDSAVGPKNFVLLKEAFKQFLISVINNTSVYPLQLNEQELIAANKFVESNILTYFGLLDEIKDITTPDMICRFLKSKIKDNDYKGVLNRAIDLICIDYKKKNESDFLSYYRHLEDSDLRFSATELLSVLDGIQNNSAVLRDSDCNRMNSIDELSKNPCNNYKVDYYFVHDTIEHLLDDDQFSIVADDIFEGNPNGNKIHPLFSQVFAQYINRFLNEIVSKDITEGIEYISSSRIQVRRMYPMEDKTEFTDCVRRYYDTKSKLTKYGPPPYKLESYNKKGHYTIFESDFIPSSFINKWIKVFNVGDHMSLEMDKNSLSLLLKVHKSPSDKNGILLADMGYGITQLFSILLQIEEMIMCNVLNIIESFPYKKKVPFQPRTLAIEEPEIHLHPKYQSLLAEVFLDAYMNYNIQFIIETHSEYLLRKIQTMIGSQKLTPEEVSMIYVEDDAEVAKGAQKVRRILIKEDGRLCAPFGPGFYDEADNLSMELFSQIGK